MSETPRRLIFNTGQATDQELAIPARDPLVRLALAATEPEQKKVPRQLAAIPIGLPDEPEQPDPFGPAIDWAFRRYEVSLEAPAGEQAFQSSIYLFNLIVALEWRPDEEYMRMLRSAFTRASDLLFDVTEGWMAFGQVVFGGPELMNCADIQIMASSRLLSRAWVAALHVDHKYMPIRIGRGLWNDNRRGTIAWEEPEGYRTLVHEWCHYALGLTDEYLQTRQVVQVGQLEDRLSLVQAPRVTTVVMPSVGSFVDSIMSTSEGTSELVTGQWDTLAKWYPLVRPQGSRRQVLAGPRWLPAALPRFRGQGTLTQPPPASAVELPAWTELRGQLAGLGLPGELQLDRCWVYVLRAAANGRDPDHVIAQGTLEAGSAEKRFALLGAQDGDAVVLIAERRDDRPIVLRAQVAGGAPTGWSAAGPPSFPTIDVVPVTPESDGRKATISVRVRGDAAPGRVLVFPLGSDKPLPEAGAISAPQEIPTLDGHVLARWGQAGEQILVSSFSQGGGPISTSPHPANPVTAGSADGGAMLFFNKGPDNDSTYEKIKVVATIAHGLGGTPAGWRERGYAYSLAGNEALPAELNPTLVMYFDPISADEESALADGDLRICRWDGATWAPLPTYLPPGYRFAVTPLSGAGGGTLSAAQVDGPRVERYRVCWVPREHR